MDTHPDLTNTNQQSPEQAKDSSKPDEQAAPLHNGPALRFQKKDVKPT